jgi:DNA-directed RNA polymerase specialized sigma24 family protein
MGELWHCRCTTAASRFNGVIYMLSTTYPTDRRAAAREQLVEIWMDPRIKNLARRHAGSPDVAEDALQSAYCAVVRVEHLDQIENLRAYFCRVLIHEVHRERGQLRAVLVEDFDRVAEENQGAAVGCHRLSPPCFQDQVCTSLQVQFWLKRLIDERDDLQAAIPARSHEPECYKAVIYAAAEQILHAGMSGDIVDADTNDMLRASYPEYFHQPGAAPNTCDQRFRRARMDVRALLRSVVSHDELF